MASVDDHDNVRGLHVRVEELCKSVVPQVGALVDVPRSIRRAERLVHAILLVAVLVRHAVPVTCVVEEEGVPFRAVRPNLFDPTQHLVPVAVPANKLRDVGDARFPKQTLKSRQTISEIVRAPLPVPVIYRSAHQSVHSALVSGVGVMRLWHPWNGLVVNHSGVCRSRIHLLDLFGTNPHSGLQSDLHRTISTRSISDRGLEPLLLAPGVVLHRISRRQSVVELGRIASFVVSSCHLGS
mmetsp:Transcript_35289/g.93976  ORF Transcript_35289/g.93976 Transcript_35289/m.93976 type:complete len:239 (+) Transcript_35289:450-1166(+)